MNNDANMSKQNKSKNKSVNEVINSTEEIDQVKCKDSKDKAETYCGGNGTLVDHQSKIFPSINIPIRFQKCKVSDQITELEVRACISVLLPKMSFLFKNNYKKTRSSKTRVSSLNRIK